MKYIFSFLLLCIWGQFSNSVYAQNYVHHFENYPVVQYDKNFLQLPGDSTKFYTFFKKLDRLIFEGEGDINIVHFGGSHVQADIWTYELRQEFQQLMPGIKGTRGLVFPYQIAKTNGPHDFKVSYTGSWTSCKNVQRTKDCPLGVSGIMVETKDTLTHILVSFKDSLQKFQSVKIFHDQDSSSFIPIPKADSSLWVMKKYQKEGYTEFIFNELIDSLSFEIQKTDSLQSHFILYGMLFEREGPSLQYHGIGVNGADLTAYLRCSKMEEQLAIINPDLVIFSVGINDANTKVFDQEFYKNNYREWIRRIKSVCPEVVIIFTTNNDSYYRSRYSNKNGVIVQKNLLELAKELDTGLWDMFEIMGGLGSVVSWQREGLVQKDKIHFTHAGYRLIGRMLCSSIIRKYQEYLSTQK